jgi:outer membrane protein OmpA-like peptidoglycan-associated protein
VKPALKIPTAAPFFRDMKRRFSFVGLAILGWSASAAAEDPRIHVAAGAAQAVGGTQGSEFGTGGAGSGTVELPVASRLGVQASAGTVVLSKGDAPKDPTIAATSTGAAFLGSAGVRIRAFGATRVAGPWIDSNIGVAHTGDLTRPSFDAHLGWDVRVSQGSRIDVGPFLGYTQIFQPDAELRGSDARILTAGIAISLGAKERARPAEPPSGEKPLPPPPAPPGVVGAQPQEDHDALAEAWESCPDGEPIAEDHCVGEVRLFENRILLDDVVHFEFDSPWIRQRSHRLVQKIARFIKEHRDIIDISIEGHADAVGPMAYNQKLSEARAASMRDLLVFYGVERSHLRVVAHGNSQPKVATTKPEYANRRVELFVTRTREKGGSSPAGLTAAAHGRNSR